MCALASWALTLPVAAGCSKRSANGERRPEKVQTAAAVVEPESDLQKLQAAVRGTWTSPWGRLEFHEDGSAEFELRTHCTGLAVTSSAVLRADCEPVEKRGVVRVEPYRLALEQGETGVLFDAFVDADGKLHLDSVDTRVTKLDPERRGTLKLGTFDSMSIGDGCAFHDEMTASPQPLECSFERDGDQTLFRFRLPDGTRKDYDPRERSLVYLERERLLVAAPLHIMSFQR